MYSYRFIQYVNFPHPPADLLHSINKNLDEYIRRVPGSKNPDTYWWSDNFNSEINAWGQENICKEMYFGFQVITGNIVLHKDTGTKIKLNYILDTGGSDVFTEFFDDDGVTKLASYNIEPKKWHIFKADTFHQVINVKPPSIRFSITGRIF